MIPSNKSPNRLMNYLTAGISVGCLAGQADAAITVTRFGPGSKSGLAGAPGINVGISFSPQQRCISGNYYLATVAFSPGAYFSSGGNLPTPSNFGYGQYTSANLATLGATLNSNQNYANISFSNYSGTSTVYEAVGQFYLDGAGGGYLVALAKNDTDTPLSISAGKTAIDAVPEPSALALLALGAGGLLARRRRTVA